MTDPSLLVRRSHTYCKVCGSIMIKREPRNGKDFEPFYSCRDWRTCKGKTRAILPDGTIMPELYYLDDLRWIFEGEEESA